MVVNRLVFTVLVAALLGSAVVGAVDARAQSGPLEGAPPALGTLYRDGDIHVDGRLDEEVWERAPRAMQFVQGEPVEGVPAQQPTAVSVLYDESALYVGATMYDSDPASIADQLVRRDEWGQYDFFEVSLDPNGDRRTGYQFRVTAAGVQRDVYLFDDVRDDEAWDAVWESAVHRDSTGWSVEMRIPLSQIRFDAADSAQTWGVNFSRRRLASNERSYFALESRVRHGRVSQFGRLEGIHLPRSARRIELRPYALTNAQTSPEEAGDPFTGGMDFTSNAGLDFRLGIGSGFTLDATVNPDFGQVEVDPAVINLTAFETFFPEKRPFFVEDAQGFNFSLSGRANGLFYSRRVGREPQGEAPDGTDFNEIPNQTTILGAAKFTGRTPGGLSVGALTALTARERGSAFYRTSGETARFTAEPRSQYGVVRAQQDFRGGASQVGAIFTTTRRNLPDDGSLDFLTTTALSGGIDFEHNWGGPRSRDWVLSGFFAASDVVGSQEALLDLQQASTHYFQRPDATRFALDSTATSMTGVEWRLQFERQSARHWTGSIWLAERTPGFEVNDLGFSTSNERLDGGARLGYQEITPGSVLRNFRINGFTFHNWRHEALDDVFSLDSWSRAHKNGAFQLRSEFQFLNYWETNLNLRYAPEVLSDVATRGGPLMVNPASTSYEFELQTDRRAALFFRPSFSYEDRHRGGYRLETELGVTLRPAPSWEIEMEPGYAQEVDPAQYVDTTDDLGFAPTYGKRYLFGDLRRRDFSVQTRVNVAFSPMLTLQLYAQPLISSGHYQRYKALEQAETFDFDVFEEGSASTNPDGSLRCAGGRTCVGGETRAVDFDADGVTDFTFDDQDFNIRSFRMNVVLRWEYRPGSTLFLVWQQNREEEVNDGRFDLGRDLDRLFAAEPENVFIVKFNYWLGL